MNYRRSGSAGLKISELSLGSWVTYGGQVGEDVAQRCMSAAYDAGVSFFDNAEAYAQGNAEVVMGNVIKKTRESSHIADDCKVRHKLSSQVEIPPPRIRTLSRNAC
jgi:aryl-alcohol dehydrogenase-like predicted oxidoreductase